MLVLVESYAVQGGIWHYRHLISLIAAGDQSSTASTETLQRSQSSTAAPSSVEPEPAVHRSSNRPTDEELLQDWQEVKVLSICCNS